MQAKTVPSMIEPLLPTAAGPMSACVLDVLGGARTSWDHALDVDGTDPYGLDLQLALYVCYELHYRGFAGVWHFASRSRQPRGPRGSFRRSSDPIRPMPCSVVSGHSRTPPLPIWPIGW
jgi:hypothetical protein